MSSLCCCPMRRSGHTGADWEGREGGEGGREGGRGEG